MVPLGSQVTEQLNKLGIAPELLQSRLSGLQKAPVDALSNLSAAYAQTASTSSVSKFGPDVSDNRVGMSPAWSNPPPKEAMRERARYIYRTYHRDQVPLHASARDMSGLVGRQRRGAMMVRKLHRDPATRRSFEHATALQVVRDGRMDGRVSVSAMTAPSQSSSSSRIPNNLFGMLSAMDTEILNYAKELGVYSSSAPEAFMGDGRSLDMLTGGAGNQFGVPSPSTSGVFGMTGVGGTSSGPNPAPVNGDQSQGLDTRILQLRRMMDKKSQMIDIVRTTFDKGNEAAKTAIGNMRA
ncbi:MAG: hypothetical protein AAFN74_22270 [Myxococcota bacterium]